MRLKNVYGKLVSKNVSRYIVEWDGPSKSKIQFKVKQFLKPFWRGLIVYEEFPVYGTLLKVDILNATLRIAVEVNGPQHEQFHYFHNGSPNAYLSSIRRDFQKNEWLETNGFTVVEINHDEVDTLNIDFFKEKFGVKL
jgi:hypothetical protein